jgi:hypothetical protein
MPHWLLPLLAGSLLIGFIVFALRQGTKVHPDRNNADNWTYTGGGGSDGSHGGFDGHH